MAERPALAWPVVGGKITNPYGATQVRSAGFTGNLPSSNVGLDIGAPDGAVLMAVADGVVVESGWSNLGWGNTILVRMADGSTYRQSHMKEAPSAARGETVKMGQQIGRVGSSGNATGPHVDVELRDPSGRNIDPTPLFGTRVAGASTMAENPLRRELQTQLQGAHTAKADADEAVTSAKAALAAKGDQAGDNDRKAVEDAVKAQTATAKTVSGLYTKIAEIDAKAAADASKPDSTKRTPEQTRIDTANADRLEGDLVDAKRKRDALADPNSPEGRTIAAQITQLETQVSAARQKMRQSDALFPGELAGQGLANEATGANTDLTRARIADIAARTGPEITRILAAAGLDDAQKASVLATMQPKIDEILAGTDFTKARTEELKATLASNLRRLGASAGLDEAQTARISGLLSGELAQQGATLAQTTANTAQTTAQTGLIGKQATGVDLANQAETRRQEAWAGIQEQIKNGTLTTPEQIRSAVAKASSSIKEYTDFLGAETQRLSLEETTRSNQEKEVQARAATRTGQQGAATEAVSNYGRFGLATAPFQMNVLSALAPVTDLHAAAKSMGLDANNPIVQSVQKSWEAFTASQRPAAAPAATVPGATPAPAAAAAIVPPPAAPLTPPQLSVSTTGNGVQAGVLNAGTSAEVLRQAAPVAPAAPVEDPGSALARALASIRQANDLQMPDEGAMPGALFAGALRPRMGGAVYE